MMLKGIKNEVEVKALGELIGKLLHGGEVIELVGDIGSGKTTLTKSIAVGLGVNDEIQSPSFTVSRVYQARDDINLIHYDFYRLTDPGVMIVELSEAIDSSKNVIVIEWAGVVENILPADRLTIQFLPYGEDTRDIICQSGGPISQKLIDGMKDVFAD